MTDTRPRPVQLYDLNDKQCGTVDLKPRGENEPPRTVVWMGRKFREGDGTGFYGPDQFAEVLK